MELVNFQVSPSDGAARVSIAVRFQDSGSDSLAEQLWFEFPAEHHHAISERADGLVMTLLPLAMQLGKPIQVKAPLSRTAIEGMVEYQRMLNAWLPHRYKVVEIIAHDARPAPERRTPATGSTFSGGFDSLFTLFRHLEPEVKAEEHRIRNAIFLHGLDIPLSDERTYAVTSIAYRAALERLGVNLITGRTNVRQFIDSSDWEMSHGAALAAAAHLLPGLWSRFYIPSSNAYWETHPWGSDYRLDHHLSSEAVRLVYDGGGFWKLDKVLAVSTHPETYDLLRICWEHPDGMMNCGRCQKCLRAMIALECAGRLKRYTVFRTGIDLGRIRGLRFPTMVIQQVEKLRGFAIASGRKDIAQALSWALACSRVRNFAKGVKRKLKGR